MLIFDAFLTFKRRRSSIVWWVPVAAQPYEGVASDLRTNGREGKSMSIVAWIILGGIAGWIGSLVVNKTGEGLLRDILLGVVGAFIGGWIFTAVGSTGVTGFNLWSLFVAVVGSVIFLVLYHALFGARRAV
jgi:uncharacterized membrane protein YeaQ/YmgE (transglycosylase-associated protein family)